MKENKQNLHILIKHYLQKIFMRKNVKININALNVKQNMINFKNNLEILNSNYLILKDYINR